MHVRVIQGDIAAIEADVVVVNLFEGVRYPGGATGAMDRALGGAVSAAIRAEKITGAFGETPVLDHAGGRVLVAGLGPSSKFDYNAVEKVSEAAAKKCSAVKGVKSIATIVHGTGIGGLDPKRAMLSQIQGFFAGWRDQIEAPELIVVEFSGSKSELFKRAVREAAKSEPQIKLREGD